MVKQVVVSAPGKIHFMGEHAVVYGKPALLAAIDKRCRVTIGHAVDVLQKSAEFGQQQFSRLQWYDSDQVSLWKARQADSLAKHSHKLANLSADFGGSGVIAGAMQVVEEKIGRIPHCTIRVESEIPIGRHLGSSAALAVAAVGALLAYVGTPWDIEMINALAYEVEKIQHGKPSGGDNTTVVYGGLVWFRREMENMVLMKRTEEHISVKLRPFWLIDTGKPGETTKEMVEYVSAKCKVQSAKCKKLFDTNEEQTRRMAMALLEGNEQLLLEAMREGERTLEELGVVSEVGKDVVQLVEEAGGAAKILGGGGRLGAVGMMLVYHPTATQEQLQQMLKFPVERVRIDYEGVRREE